MVKSVTEQDSVQKAAVVMRNEGVGFLPVCNGEGRMVGVITDRDIVTRGVADERTLPTTPVSSIMTRDLVTCAAEDPVSFAEMRMRSKAKNRIVCVDGAGKPVGVISGSDLRHRRPSNRVLRALRAFATNDAQP